MKGEKNERNQRSKKSPDSIKNQGYEERNFISESVGEVHNCCYHHKVNNTERK
jgi:hypothetical protein